MFGRNNIESSLDGMENLIGIIRSEAISSIRTRAQALAAKDEEGKHFYIMKVIYIIEIYILYIKNLEYIKKEMYNNV